MASELVSGLAITDANYRPPSSPGLAPSPTPPSITEVWAVDTEELRRGSSAGAGPRDAGALAATTRWQWVAAPPFDQAQVTTVLEAAVGPGPRAVRICPGTEGHRFPLASWALAPFPELCDEANVAVALDYGAQPALPWGEVVDLARRHPSLCLVLLGRGAGELGVMRSCLDAAPNVIFDISGLGDAAWLARAVAEVGAHRFIFGSGGDPAGAVELLVSAGLVPADTDLVGSGVAESVDQGSWGESWL